MTWIASRPHVRSSPPPPTFQAPLGNPSKKQFWRSAKEARMNYHGSNPRLEQPPPPSFNPLYGDPATGKNGPREKENAKMANERASRGVAGWRCGKHPKHQQSTGVCSLCLSKKLSQISRRSYLRGSTRANRRYSRSSSPSSAASSESSYHSSSESSSCSSPIHRYGRFAHEAKSGPVSMLFGGKDGLKKSRSVAFVPKTGASGDCAKEIVKREKSKGGFWSKLIPARRKRNGAEGGDVMRLQHSLTQRERVTM